MDDNYMDDYEGEEEKCESGRKNGHKLSLVQKLAALQIVSGRENKEEEEAGKCRLWKERAVRCVNRAQISKLAVKKNELKYMKLHDTVPWLHRTVSCNRKWAKQIDFLHSLLHVKFNIKRASGYQKPKYRNAVSGTGRHCRDKPHANGPMEWIEEVVQWEKERQQRWRQIHRAYCWWQQEEGCPPPPTLWRHNWRPRRRLMHRRMPQRRWPIRTKKVKDVKEEKKEREEVLPKGMSGLLIALCEFNQIEWRNKDGKFEEELGEKLDKLHEENNKFVQSLRLVCTHTKSDKAAEIRAGTFHLTKGPVQELFKMDGLPVTLRMFFWLRHHRRLHFPRLPCVAVQNGGKQRGKEKQQQQQFSYFPLELISIGQESLADQFILAEKSK